MTRRPALLAVPVLVTGLVIQLVALPHALASGGLPVVRPDTYRVAYDQVLEVGGRGVLANDRDPERDPLVVQPGWGPFLGSLDLRPDGSFTYTPHPGQSGVDSFTYHVFDGTGWEQGSATIIVNAPPVPQDDYYTVAKDGLLRVAAPGLQSNDYDSLGTRLRSSLVDDPAHGKARIRWNGWFQYRPEPGFVGWDSFTYRVWDRTYITEATVWVQVKDGNAAPVAVADSYEMYEDNVLSFGAPGVLANDTDADTDDILRAELVSDPGIGYLDFYDDGSFTYTPYENYDSPVTFRYRVCDGTTCSAAVDVVIDIVAVNDPPFGEDDYFGVSQDDESFIGAPGVLANDYDPVEGDSLFVGTWGTPGSGTLAGNADGSFTYTPDPGFSGWDVFSYSVCDSGGCASASVSIEVFADDPPPE